MKPFGVKVCAIEPGFFRTAVTAYEAHRQSTLKLWEKMPQEVRDDYGHDYLEKGTPGPFHLVWASHTFPMP